MKTLTVRNGLQIEATFDSSSSGGASVIKFIFEKLLFQRKHVGIARLQLIANGNCPQVQFNQVIPFSPID